MHYVPAVKNWRGNEVPPFVIFHDATLAQMLERQPQTREQFARLNGVGDTKLEKYADHFLQLINQHSNNSPSSCSDTVNESLLLLRSGLDVAHIAAQRQLKVTTIYSHLANCIEQGKLKLDEAVDLSKEDIDLIHDTFLQLDDGSKKLKPVYDALDGLFDYGILRCVMASVAPS